MKSFDGCAALSATFERNKITRDRCDTILNPCMMCWEDAGAGGVSAHENTSQ